MIFKEMQLPDRVILQGDNVQYDSYIMSELGQNFEAKKVELLAAGHSIEEYDPEAEG
jgi:hypothetical protein